MKIAIHGPMCSGKTTLANLIMQLDSRHKIFSFGQFHSLGMVLRIKGRTMSLTSCVLYEPKCCMDRTAEFIPTGLFPS